MSEPETFFQCRQKELDWLCSRDPQLASFIKKTGALRRAVIADPFLALIHAVMGQQISGAAHKTIWRRFLEIVQNPDEFAVEKLGIESLKACGVSKRKSAYISNIAREFSSGGLKREELAKLSDEKLIARLCELPGVGPWTAEMLLIFCFQRRNVLSLGDLGIQKGMKFLYAYEKITPEIFERHKRIYSPCCTAASLYLWEAAALSAKKTKITQ